MIILIWKQLKNVVGCDGIVLFPFIIFSDKRFSDNKQVMNHERIHVRQVLELLIIPFYLLYIMEFLIRRFSSKSKYEAYRKISFEQEAYSNDHDQDYLKKRTPYQFAKYLKQ